MKKSGIKSSGKGQGMTEYIIIIALLAIGTITIMRTFGQTIQAQFSKITKSMQGQASSDVNFTSVNKNDYKRKGLSDYANNISK